MRKLVSTALAAAALAAPALPVAAAPPPPSAQVVVTIGASLQAKADDYGAREFPELADDLKHAVARRAAKAGFTRLELVLEDAVPNRPTAAMLGRCVSLDFRSLSRGGAEVTGTAYGPSGPQSVRFSWWSYDLQDSAMGGGIWSDADRAFQLLGSELAHGRTAGRLDRDKPSGRSYGPGLNRAWGGPC